MLFRGYDRLTQMFWPGLQPSVGHFGLIVFRFVIVSAASIGLSFISRKYYEEWFLQLKDRVAPEPVAERPANVVVLTPPSTSVEASESL
jgi:peptidoglycan/LPS O-acetylase OafA/YrhL